MQRQSKFCCSPFCVSAFRPQMPGNAEGTVVPVEPVSHGIYGSPRIDHDLREAGTRCGVKRVARLMRQIQLKSVRGYKRPRHKACKPAIAAPNRLGQQFTFAAPDQAWVTDITYIRTYEGWLYLAVVIDLYSRAVIGWSMKPSMATELALDALMMAVWRRKPINAV